MRSPTPLYTQYPQQVSASGTHLLVRGSRSDEVLYLESGRVVLGVLGTVTVPGEFVEHQLGAVEGPSWLDAASAQLQLPCVVDAVAITDTVLRRVPLHDFLSELEDCSPAARSIMLDVARAHRAQTELAVSRVAKDAEARCAEWLLRHAQAREEGGCGVQLQQRKRAIAGQLGIAPETLSRVLRQLRERSLISGSGRNLDLVDPSGLRLLAGFYSPCPSCEGCAED